jgi:hypothetical protein
MGSTLFSGGRSSILSLLGVDPEWHGIVGSLYGGSRSLIFASTDEQPAYFVLERWMGLAYGRAARIDGCQCAGISMLF